MTKWQEVKLGDICDVRDGTHDTPKESSEGKYLITSKHIKGGKIDLSSAYKISLEDFNFVNQRSKVDKWDILISMIGTVGEICLVSEYPDFAIKNVGLIKTENEYLAKYLYYYLKSPTAQNDILSRLKGTTQQYLSLGEIRNFPVIIPPLEIQKKIAVVLSALDDKIELNNKINNNLEQQAQALFKSWFVDFEPFGGTMPEDWKVGTFSEIIDDTIGGDWGKDEAQNNYTEEVYCIRGADIPDVKIGNKGKMPKRYILTKNYSSKKLRAGDLVIEISGGSPTQSTGRIAAISDYLLSRYDNKIICTNFCRALKPKLDYSEYIYHYWQYLYNKNVFFSYENGTTGIKNLDISGFLETEKISIPNQVVLKKFSELCDKFFKQIYFNGAENERLSALRDALLPKLISGEIDVSNVDISALTSTDKLSFTEE